METLAKTNTFLARAAHAFSSSIFFPLLLVVAMLMIFAAPSCGMMPAGFGYDYSTPEPQAQAATMIGASTVAAALPSIEAAQRAPQAQPAPQVVAAPHPVMPSMPIMPTGNPILDLGQLILLSGGPLLSFIAGQKNHRKLIYPSPPNPASAPAA